MCVLTPASASASAVLCLPHSQAQDWYTKDERLNVMRYVTRAVELKAGDHVLQGENSERNQRSEADALSFSALIITPLSETVAPAPTALKFKSEKQLKVRAFVDGSLRCKHEHTMERRVMRVLPKLHAHSSAQNTAATAGGEVKESLPGTSLPTNPNSFVPGSDTQALKRCEFCGLPTAAKARPLRSITSSAHELDAHDLEYAECPHTTHSADSKPLALLTAAEAAAAAERAGPSAYAHLACAARVVYYVELTAEVDIQSKEGPGLGLIEAMDPEVQRKGTFCFFRASACIPSSSPLLSTNSLYSDASVSHAMAVATTWAPSKHQHALVLTPNTSAGFKCQKCRQQKTGSSYHCAACPWDECRSCYGQCTLCILWCFVVM
jgi:hypothetical protein